MNLVTRRPTETAAGLGIALAVYGFLAEQGVPNGLAAVLAVLAAFGPALVTAITDARFRAKGLPLEDSAGEDLL